MISVSPPIQNVELIDLRQSPMVGRKSGAKASTVRDFYNSAEPDLALSTSNSRKSGTYMYLTPPRTNGWMIHLPDKVAKAGKDETKGLSTQNQHRNWKVCRLRAFWPL
jgi:hypothetical protein